MAIVSERPQTTRRAVRGVATDIEAGWQLVLVDLPGVQRPRDVLTERMQRRVERELADSDVALLVVNGEEGVGPGDRFIARALLAANAEVPVVCAVNKVDRLSPARDRRRFSSEAAALEVVGEVFPVSARTGAGLDGLVARLAELMPEGPYMYPPGEPQRPAERAAARGADPRAGAEPDPRRDPALGRGLGHRGLDPRGRPDHGAGRDLGGLGVAEGHPDRGRGRKVGEIGTAARRELERELGARVHLDLQVRVRRHWRRDASLLDRLGIE